jgi:hypothetical protein
MPNCTCLFVHVNGRLFQIPDNQRSHFLRFEVHLSLRRELRTSMAAAKVKSVVKGVSSEAFKDHNVRRAYCFSKIVVTWFLLEISNSRRTPLH